MTAQTLGPASHTFNAPLKKRTSMAPIVVGIVALVGGAAVAAFGIRTMTGASSASDPPHPSGAAVVPQPLPTHEPPPRVQVAPAPIASADPSASTNADDQQEAPTREVQRPVAHPKTGAQPRQQPTPPPARSGKVRIRP